jgi:uncharacterized protein (TIGR00106 family)
MKVSIDLCVIPVGETGSLSPAIAECQRLLTAAGLSPQLHPFGTCVEGDWDTVMNAVRRCHERLHALGQARVFSTLKLSTRNDREQTLADKVDAVRSHLSD